MVSSTQRGQALTCLHLLKRVCWLRLEGQQTSPTKARMMIDWDYRAKNGLVYLTFVIKNIKALRVILIINFFYKFFLKAWKSQQIISELRGISQKLFRLAILRTAINLYVINFAMGLSIKLDVLCFGCDRITISLTFLKTVDYYGLNDWVIDHLLLILQLTMIN